MNQRSQSRNQLVISYMTLRQAVGWIGTLLPIVLLAGHFFFSSTSLPGSMSGYYYTNMRNIFVGALCALGVFLAAYDGYDDVDRWITNIAGFSAIVVAMCPTKPAVCAPQAPKCSPPSVTQLSTSQQVVGDVHLAFAAITFIALGLMALRFAKDGPTPDGLSTMRRVLAGLGFGRSGGNNHDDVAYRVTGTAILSCVVLAALANLLPGPVKTHWHPLFWFEASAVFFFGISWFVKGRAIRAMAAMIPQRTMAATNT